MNVGLTKGKGAARRSGVLGVPTPAPGRPAQLPPHSRAISPAESAKDRPRSAFEQGCTRATPEGRALVYPDGRPVHDAR